MKLFHHLACGLALYAFTLAAVTGCGRSETTQAVQQQSNQASAQQTDNLVKSIQNNPNMSPDAKARAIAQIKQRAGTNTRGQSASSATTTP